MNIIIGIDPGKFGAMTRMMIDADAKAYGLEVIPYDLAKYKKMIEHHLKQDDKVMV